MNNPIVVGLLVGICVYLYQYMKREPDNKEPDKPTVPILVGCMAWLLACLYRDYSLSMNENPIIITSSPYEGRTFRLSDGRRVSGQSSLNWGNW